MLESDFLEKSKSLQDAFLESIPTILTELLDLVQTQLFRENDYRSLNLIYHRLHQLVGGASSFGFEKLGAKVKSLEKLVLDLLSNQVTLNLEQLHQLSRELSEILKGPEYYQHLSLEAVVAREIIENLSEKVPRLHVLALTNDRALEITNSLKTFGYEVSHGVGLTHFQQDEPFWWPSLLIVDVFYAREVKNSFLHKVPCIFFSEKSDFASQLAAVRSGGLGYFANPFNTSKLVDRVTEVLRHSRIESYRVLIVDDDLLLAQYFQLVLQTAGFIVEVTTEPRSVLETLRKFQPELLLLDVDMPECSGAELAQMIRFQEEWLTLPIVFLSAESDWDRQIQILGSGGDDFLTKPIKNRHLIKSIELRAERSRLLNDLIARDSMTGLLKHARIKEQLKLEALRAKRAAKPLCAVMLDIDHFKKVNDTYGHGMGDRVIKTLAQLLKQRLRQTDLIGRYGGEEFLVILPETSLEISFKVIEDIRVRFSNIQFIFEAETFLATFSAGIALYEDSLDSLDVLLAADKCLYQAKNQGRNQTVVQAKGTQTNLATF